MRRAWTFYLVVALFWCAQYVYMPFFSPYLSALGTSASLIGLIAGVYGFAQLALRIPISIEGTRRGSHKLIMRSGLICIVLACTLPLFTDFWFVYFMTRLLAGAASSTWVSYSAYLLEGAGEKANQRMGYISVANTGGICFSQILGTILYDYTGIKPLFVIAAVSAVVALVLLAFIPLHKVGQSGNPTAAPQSGADVAQSEDLAATPQSAAVILNEVNNLPASRGALEHGALRQVLTNRNLWLCSILLTIGNYVGFSSNMSFSGIYAQDRLAAGALHLGLIAFLFQLGGIGMSSLIGKLGARRLPERGMMTAGFIILAAYCAATPFCDSAVLHDAMQLIAGVGMPMISVLMFANAGRELGVRQQLLSMGVFQSVYSIGMTAGPAVTGLLFDYTGGSYEITFIHLSAVAVGGAACAFFLYKNSWKCAA